MKWWFVNTAVNTGSQDISLARSIIDGATKLALLAAASRFGAKEG